MINCVGFEHAQRLLQLGTMLSPKQALEIRLLDQLVKDKAELMTEAESKCAVILLLSFFSSCLFLRVCVSCFWDLFGEC